MITLILRNPEAVKARIAEDEKKSELVQKNLTEAYEKIKQAQKILVSYTDRGCPEFNTSIMDSFSTKMLKKICHINNVTSEILDYEFSNKGEF